MQNTKLVAKCEDLKLKGSSASERGDQRGHERCEHWPARESKEERRPLSGGAVREVLESVEFADWSPDGESLAVARKENGLAYRVEYPIGHLLDAGPDGDVTAMRVSPDGDSVAYLAASLHGGRVLKVISRSHGVRLAATLETQRVGSW